MLILLTEGIKLTTFPSFLFHLTILLHLSRRIFKKTKENLKLKREKEKKTYNIRESEKHDETSAKHHTSLRCSNKKRGEKPSKQLNFLKTIPYKRTKTSDIITERWAV